MLIGQNAKTAGLIFEAREGCEGAQRGLRSVCAHVVHGKRGRGCNMQWMKEIQNKALPATLLWLVILQEVKVQGEAILDRFTGEIGGGNFTYYRLQWPTTPVTILLESLEGDADLYVSDKTLTPSYEDNVASSITCGDDRVDITREFQRPVGIGVYGNPLKELSKYRLSVIVLEGTEEVTYDILAQAHKTYGDMEEASENYNNEDHYKTSTKHASSKHATVSKPGDEEETESLLWTILVAILKLIFEILT